MNQEFRTIIQQVLREHGTPARVEETAQGQEYHMEHTHMPDQDIVVHTSVQTPVHPADEGSPAAMGIPVLHQQARGKESRVGDRVYHRRRFCMFRFVYNRIIEKTYQRKNKGKKLEDKGKAETPITTEGLRRSPRLTELNAGHRDTSATISPIAQPRSSSQQEGINDIVNLAGITPSSSDFLFSGPTKFPTMKDIEEGIIPVPEISVQAIQEVAMEKCGLSPERWPRSC